jgi:FixJ family two-component response regulator
LNQRITRRADQTDMLVFEVLLSKSQRDAYRPQQEYQADAPVVAFSGADQLLESSRLDEISCLISDVQMPGMNGLELYQRLAVNNKLIPTILITAYPDERTQQRAREIGITCYLTKPFNEADLIACLHAVPHFQLWKCGS